MSERTEALRMLVEQAAQHDMALVKDLKARIEELEDAILPFATMGKIEYEKTKGASNSIEVQAYRIFYHIYK